MPAQQIIYLSRADVEAVALDMPTIINRLEAAFLEKSQGKVEMPPKPGVHPRADAFIHAMPAYIPSLRAAGIKWVSGFPENMHQGLPYISGLIILNDVETGLPYAVMDCTWITAYRTGAKTAIAARHLARADSEVAGILACGMQGRTNLIGLASVFPPSASMRMTSTRRPRPNTSPRCASASISRSWVSEPRQAVVESDWWSLRGHPARPAPHHPKDAEAAVLARRWITTRTGAGGAGADGPICTDDLPQFEDHRRSGYFKQTPQPYAEMGELVAGTKPGAR